MTASSMEYSSGKHSRAKEERKVFQSWMHKGRILRLDQASRVSCPPPPTPSLGALLQLLLLSQMRKPLIERKRRERINNCLDQLKEAVIGAFQLDVSITPPPPPHVLHTHLETCFTPVSQQQSKLEKADILEMTVRHLQNIQSTKRGGEGSQTWFLIFGIFAL